MAYKRCFLTRMSKHGALRRPCDPPPATCFPVHTPTMHPTAPKRSNTTADPAGLPLPLYGADSPDCQLTHGVLPARRVRTEGRMGIVGVAIGCVAGADRTGLRVYPRGRPWIWMKLHAVCSHMHQPLVTELFSSGRLELTHMLLFL